MHRTTIMLPATLKARAERKAKAQGISLGEFIRDAVAAAVNGHAPAPANDPFFTDIVVYEGPVPADGSINHDHYLYGDASDLH